MPAAVILGTQRPTTHEIVMGNPMLEQPAEGWDVLIERLWLPHPTWIRRGMVREGPAPEGGTFIVQDIRPLEWLAGCPVVQVISHGIALQGEGKDYKLEGSGSISEDLSLASGLYLTPTIWREGYYRVTKLWVALNADSEAPLDAHINVSYLPPSTFGLPTNTWAMAWVSATNWTAYGWRGESRTVQKLPGSPAGLVTDTWLYDPGNDDRDGVSSGIIYL
jgi:hypothetical protein